jgi:hypothetical protein
MKFQECFFIFLKNGQKNVQKSKSQKSLGKKIKKINISEYKSKNLLKDANYGRPFTKFELIIDKL